MSDTNTCPCLTQVVSFLSGEQDVVPFQYLQVSTFEHNFIASRKSLSLRLQAALFSQQDTLKGLTAL